MDHCPSVSFIGIVDFTEDAKWLYCSASVHDLLGFEPRELIGRPSLELVHPDEFAQVRGIHYSTITQDQAAVLAYLRMRHKDPCKGYVLCAISRTVCQNVLVGSVSYATPGPKAMHNASTAQEVTIITPTAKDFEFRRWNDPSPMPPCPVPPHMMPNRPGSPPTATNNTYPEHFDPLPEQSVRTALILNRFTVHCTVQYCSNDSILRTTDVLGRPFWDFVSKRDEELVRSWIDVIKGWGVNERGQPSDGGFGYGKFTLLVRGRDSSERPGGTGPAPRHHRARAQRNHARPSDSTNAAPSRATARGADFLRELTRERPPPPPPPPSEKHPAQHHSRHEHRPERRDERERAAAAPSLRREQADELLVDAIFSAHSDGLMVILRRSSAPPPPPAAPTAPAPGHHTASSASASPPSAHASPAGSASPPHAHAPAGGGGGGGALSASSSGASLSAFALPPLLERTANSSSGSSSGSSGFSAASGYGRRGAQWGR